MDPIRSNSLLVRSDRLPVPARTDSRAVVVATGDGEPTPAVATARAHEEGFAGKLLANAIDPMMFRSEAAEGKRQAHAAAEQSYRRTSSLGWGVRRTIDFEV